MDTKALFNDMVSITRAKAKLITKPVYSIAPDNDGGYQIEEYKGHGEYATIASINPNAISLAIALVARANKEEQ
jgi:hypothetical protein